ncbi:glycosyltransferase 87 family protein [Rhodococcus coprophilus]|uniref:Mannosyltransferase n=1 Tax=Rhodococcus coprophilus TaxID=38310 RepID=A0A2X4UAT0_9NOCA|nr:glycosyltransferase 87 family protein [Rhodococcus coprophilus]MBM7459422.1 alpha-1,2-mannosyltransferase [Rhodococcus coprophilus]SQI36021.1 mannosyltransferase [Rhodococcus coprophilus]
MRHLWLKREDDRPPTGLALDLRAHTTLLAVIVALSIASTIAFLVGNDYIDLLVYRMGARVLLDGGDIYGPIPPVVDDFGLPFTYPPLSAVLFVPLALLPVTLAKYVFGMVSVAALVVTLRLVLGRVRPGLSDGVSWVVTAVAVAVALQLEPVRETVSFGQINMVLMALVAVDVLAVKPKWPRGVLIGLAAAIKLTPAGFLLLFLLARDWRTSARIVVSAAGFSAAAYVLMPEASTRYWLHALPDTGRIGSAYYAANQSFKAVVARFGPPDPLETALWLGAAAVMLVVAIVAIRLALARGALVLALLANAAAVLLASPVSWSHHWVWVAPALLVLTFEVLQAPTRRRIAAAIGIGLIFLIGPHHLLPAGDGRELDWALLQHVIGSMYVTIAFGFLIALTQIRQDPAAGDSVEVDPDPAVDTARRTGPLPSPADEAKEM